MQLAVVVSCSSSRCSPWLLPPRPPKPTVSPTTVQLSIAALSPLPSHTTVHPLLTAAASSRAATETGRYAVALLVKDSEEPGGLRHIWLDTAFKIPTQWLRTADTQQRISDAGRAAIEGRTIAIDMTTRRDCRGSTIVRLRMVGDVLTAGRAA